ncbi:MAG TPA: HAMP domain-containing sensor histidine kinase [Bauldia sp.]|nr:HAMP domain-containing sensor histidine kinase [Bauldia sp.]
MRSAAPSIRIRLLVAAVVSIVATLVVAGVSLGAVFERQVLKRVDQELQVRWDELAAALTLDANGRPSLARELTDPRYRKPYSGAYWQIVENGTPLATSRSLWDVTLDTSDRSRTYNDSGSFEVAGPNDAATYVLSRRVNLDGRTFELDVALDHEEVDALRAAFERDVILILGPIALVLALGAWLQIRQSLNPLRDLDRELKAVHDGARSRLEGSFPREVEPVVTDLNRLLERQEQLVRKARDRAGALAHGLKTPLTILSGEARRLELQGQREAAAKINGQLELIGRHVDRELARARAAGASASAGTFAHAAATTERLFRLMRHMPRGDALLWRNEVPVDLILRIDPDDFGEVLGNLVDNARKWAETQVAVRAERDEGMARIMVLDDGPGFAAGTPDPQADRGVSRGPDSTGLGLGIVHDILSEYGVALEVERVDGMCAVSFVLPTGAVTGTLGATDAVTGELAPGARALSRVA